MSRLDFQRAKQADKKEAEANIISAKGTAAVLKYAHKEKELDERKIQDKHMRDLELAEIKRRNNLLEKKELRKEAVLVNARFKQSMQDWRDTIKDDAALVKDLKESGVWNDYSEAEKTAMTTIPPRPTRTPLY